MKYLPIVWTESKVTAEIAGYVINNLMFFITKKGKRNPKYVLQSYPFRNDTFAKANVTKKLFVDQNLEDVKNFAQHILVRYINLFIEKDTIEPATLTAFSLYHAQANPERGIVISDIDELQKLAKEFEKQYKELRIGGKNWENSLIGWEDSIIGFYNAFKPISWNKIN